MKIWMKLFLFLCGSLLFFTNFAVCAEPNIYPSKGQNQKQQEQDQSEEIGSMFLLASELKRVLKPVSEPDFKFRLRDRLDSYTPSDVIIAAPKAGYQLILVVIASIGSFLSLIGLVAFFRRWGKNSAENETNSVTPSQ